MHIPRELFLRMLQEYPELAARMHQRLAVSVKGMMKEMSGIHEKMRSIANLAPDQAFLPSANADEGEHFFDPDPMINPDRSGR